MVTCKPLMNAHLCSTHIAYCSPTYMEGHIHPHPLYVMFWLVMDLFTGNAKDVEKGGRGGFTLYPALFLNMLMKGTLNVPIFVAGWVDFYICIICMRKNAASLCDVGLKWKIGNGRAINSNRECFLWLSELHFWLILGVSACSGNVKFVVMVPKL